MIIIEYILSGLLIVGALVILFIRRKEKENKRIRKDKKMQVGERVKIKDYKDEATIICVYAVPKDWDLVDVEFDNGDILRGVSTEICCVVQTTK